MKGSVKLIIGVCLLILGFILLLDRTGLFLTFGIDIWSTIGMFWPLILIAIGIKLFFDNNTTGGIVLFILGSVIFLTKLFDWNFFSVLWPLLIMGIGLSILLKKESHNFNKASSETDNDKLKETVLFWGVEKKITSKEFKGGDLDVAFGGLELDLREASISKDGAKLNINVAFGGVTIYVPKNCRVKTNGVGILGGWDPSPKANDIKEPVLEITGSGILGRVEIKA